jgi:predicted membrane-bound spermidine synthase
MSFKRSMVAIALVAMATLMFELLVNKALGFSTWSGLGYMIIGSAIFGYSIAGVVIAIWKPHEKYAIDRLLGYSALGLALAMLASYVVMNVVPFGFGNMYYEPLANLVYFTIWYVTLLIPFSLSGFIIALLLTVFKDQSNRLYGADLIGAGIGCLIVVPLFPQFGAGGIYAVCAAIAAACAVIFTAGKVRWLTVAALAGIAGLAVYTPLAETVYPVASHDIKRERADHYRAGWIQNSQWSFLSKIEVAIVPNRDRSLIWIDGGLMQSDIDKFDGNYDEERQRERATGPSSIAYRIRPRENALIIAPAGGGEVRTALAWGAGRVTAVELDPSIVALVRDDLNDYLGGIYRDARVNVVNDEGRSFVRRSTEKYDVIQFISAYSKGAAQTGAVDMVSSYLVTSEAFQDYLDHLAPEGMLSISYASSLRLFVSLWHALEARGLDPTDRIVLIHNDSSTLTPNTILVKLTPFTPEDLAVIRGISANRLPINYAPAGLMADVDRVPGLVSQPKTRRLVEEFVATPTADRESFYGRFPYRTWPVSDDQPYYMQWRYFGVDVAKAPDRLTEEIEDHIDKREYIPLVPLSEASQIVILIEAGLLAALFLVFPLWKFKSDGIRTRSQKLALLYFLSLGLAFIWVEVVFLKAFILFLGSPVYSIAVVLFAMLVFAGLGSFYSERLRGTLGSKLALIGAGLVLISLAVAFLYPSLLQAFLGLSLPGRALVAVALMAPVGFVLGMPFPVGLSVLAKSNPQSIPWAWAMNGYATVVGISSAALIAMRTGYTMLILMSLVVYMLGFLALSASSKARLAEA